MIAAPLMPFPINKTLKKKKKGGKGELKTRNTTSVLTLVFLVVGFHYYLYKQS